MKQEDYNAMMRYPGERYERRNLAALPTCPQCGERYMGDGIVVCTECQSAARPTAAAAQKKEES